jgi:uncharacterized membrane protein (UPF0127 family)
MTGVPDRLRSLPVRALPGDLRVFDAASPAARLRGLAGLRDLGAHIALHLPRTRSVHTFGMRFALDLVWLDDRGDVVRIDRDVAPRRLRACRRARSVLEAPAGAADAFLRAGYTAAR